MFKKFVLTICAGLGASLLLYLPQTGAQNLLENPDFETSLDGWQLLGGFGVTAVWDNRDFDDSVESGSMLGTLPAESTFRIPVYAVQCVRLTPGRTYVFGGDIFLPSDTSPPSTFSTVFVNIYENDGCFGGASQNVVAPNVTALDQWTLTLAEVDVSIAEGSAQVNLRVRAPEGTLRSHFDNVFISAVNEIFLNGFE